MKIGIIGTRGIPNHHGGFEQFAEYFSTFLAKKGYSVYVYNSSLHPYKKKTFKGVNLIHCNDYEHKIGTAGQFIYDFNCITNSRSHNFDIILQLGYTSSSIWHMLLPKKAIIITNMDGLEWKRTKYKKSVQNFLKYAEKLAAKTSDYLVADSLGIKEHLLKSYKKQSTYIAYGADVFDTPAIEVLREYHVSKEKYNLLIARLEPENNIETILNGVDKSQNDYPFLVIGKHDTKFGVYLKTKFKNNKKILFLGGIYNQNHLNNLRYFSNIYFHGHSVGGTNPSLLEAMASNTLIIANENMFNKSILEDDAFYFNNETEVATHLSKKKGDYLGKVENNTEKISQNFTWNKINNQYETLFKECLRNSK